VASPVPPAPPPPGGDLTHYELHGLVPQTGHLVAALICERPCGGEVALADYLPPFTPPLPYTQWRWPGPAHELCGSRPNADSAWFLESVGGRGTLISSPPPSSYLQPLFGGERPEQPIPNKAGHLSLPLSSPSFSWLRDGRDLL